VNNGSERVRFSTLILHGEVGRSFPYLVAYISAMVVKWSVGRATRSTAPASIL
jgi:hypothetical protein